MPVFPIDPSLLEHGEFGLKSLSWSNVGHAVCDFLVIQPFLKAKLIARKAQNLQLVTEFLTHFVEKFVAGGGQASRACSVTNENGLPLQGVQVQLVIFHEILGLEPCSKESGAFLDWHHALPTFTGGERRSRVSLHTLGRLSN